MTAESRSWGTLSLSPGGKSARDPRRSAFGIPRLYGRVASDASGRNCQDVTPIQITARCRWQCIANGLSVSLGTIERRGENAIAVTRIA